jgi:CHU_C Type IX secretion signal domain
VKKLFLLSWLLLALPLLASHIVGGEFELLYVSGNTYRLNLVMYFDKINGNPGAKDGSIDATIFRKSDNRIMKTVRLSLTNEAAVSYTQPSCSNGEIETNKLIYTSLVTLPAADFGDPGGYYVSWERCCRNYTITNIYSQNPASSSSIAAGQTFYLEFPPVVKNGEAFINSSPHLFPPLNDYACPNRPYYVDFAGVDDDGDSLVYSLVTPLNTHSAVALPPAPTPQPYPEIQWRPGYGLNSILKGNPDLAISRRGLLTTTPLSQGLYVFAVKIEEFRNKEKIGESSRDFQMLVVDACPQAEPPQIRGKQLADNAFIYNKTMSVAFSKTTNDNDRCIQVQVSDPDSNKPESSFSENIKIRVVGLNFKDPDLDKILPTEVSGTLTNGSTKEFRICFPLCPFIKGPYQIGIIAMDDACSLPMLDTLKVTVNVEAPANIDPYFVTPATSPTNGQLLEGTSGSWDFEVRDNDGDELNFSAVGLGFKLSDAGMKVEVIERQNGLIKGRLTWNALCSVYKVFVRQGEFRVKLSANDNDLCNVNDPAVAILNLSVVSYSNTSPQLTISNKNPNVNFSNDQLDVVIGNQIILSIDGFDPDDYPKRDSLTLQLVNADGTYKPEGYIFSAVKGIGSVNSIFSWNPECTIFQDGLYENIYTFKFRLKDHRCTNAKTDSVEVKIKIKDIEPKEERFTPSNVFTPNNDGLNEYYAMELRDTQTGELTNILPFDNCEGRFEQIRIFNRWGNQVYESTDRNFKWHGKEEPAGVYYYQIKYSNREYKGAVSLRN